VVLALTQLNQSQALTPHIVLNQALKYTSGVHCKFVVKISLTSSICHSDIKLFAFIYNEAFAAQTFKLFQLPKSIFLLITIAGHLSVIANEVLLIKPFVTSLASYEIPIQLISQRTAA
jgi:hypothetical protein